MKRSRSLGAAVVLVGALLGRSAAAQDADLEAVLESQVVTAPSQSAEVTTDAPATTSVITAEAIRRHGIRSLEEALNYLALGVFTTNPSHGVEIGARGVAFTGDFGNHVLLLVDGHAVNEPWGGAASFDRGLGVPIELVDHIEVVLGPGSVLYGSNAVLAVIHVVTKRAKDWSGLRVVADSDPFRWWKLGVGGGTAVNVLGRSFEITTQLEYQKQDGPVFDFAPQAYGDDPVTGQPKRFSPDGPATGVWGGRAARSNYFRAPAGYLRIVSGNLDASFRASSYMRSMPYLDSIVQMNGDFDAPNDYEVEKWLSGDVKYRIPVSRVLSLRLRGYADAYTYDAYATSSAAGDCYDGQVDGCRMGLFGRSRWLGGEVQSHVDWLTTGRLVTLLGVDARTEAVQGLGRYLPVGAGPAVEYHRFSDTNLRLGVYAQQTAKVTDWLSLNAGIRGDVAEGYPGALSPRAAAAVTPWEGGTLKAVYSEAFRAPSTYERQYEDASWLRNPTLRPEHARSYETSFAQQLGAHRLLIGVFDARYRDVVALGTATSDEVEAARSAGAQKLDDSTIYRNADRVTTRGYNAAVEGSLAAQRLRYGVNVTGAYARRETPDGKQPVTVAPALFGNARVSYDLGAGLPTLALAAQMQSRRPADRAFDAGYAPAVYAPPLVELRAAVSGPVPLVEGLSYRLTANYAFENAGPYVVGAVRDGSYGLPPTLNPVERFRAGIGLTYVLDP